MREGTSTRGTPIPSGDAKLSARASPGRLTYRSACAGTDRQLLRRGLKAN